MEMQAIIETKSLNKTFKLGSLDVEVLKDINLTIDPGEFVSIMGPSGSGKSTLLYLIGGLDKPTAGSVKIKGSELSEMKDRDQSIMRRRDIGFVFQFYNLVPNLTALENVELAAQICQDSLSASETLDKVGLTERKSNFPAQLSGGEQQRVSIARAIAKNPKLLLCDEPTGALDYNTGKQILQLLQDTCRRENITVLLITHNSALAPMADKVIHFKSGKVVKTVQNEQPTPIAQIEW